MTAIAAALLGHLTRALIGWPGYIAILTGLVVLAAAILVARRDVIEWRGLLPLTVLGFIAWCGASVFWSGAQWMSLAGWVFQAVIALIGITIALCRDLIQIVRAAGGVFRVLLAVSIGLEILSGILLDTPFPFLGIGGNLAVGGPIQGVFGTRNLLGFVAVLALVTHIIELRTRSVQRGTGIASITLAATCLVFSGSPVTVVVSVVILAATSALYAVRRTPAERRPVLQYALLGLVIVTMIATYAGRSRVIDLLNAGGEFQVRYRLWLSTWRAIDANPIEGWGWVGLWRGSVPPFAGINWAVGQEHASALNAYLDVLLQVGTVGFLIFAALCAFAVIRSWLLASNRRTVTYAWPALVVVTILTTGAAESFPLVEGGWLLLVICAVKASESHSWRARLPN
ncbi:exopolysaccharide production protein [Labedella endophytica]|uniref:Exopolysaccharide production protein n=2 Tax=Labedella endophytica TaxID=1523160 RepID=A0A3S0Y1F4_9MICO|nr:exopolysaccharide production protein [Labedella endophytica]